MVRDRSGEAANGPAGAHSVDEFFRAVQVLLQDRAAGLDRQVQAYFGGLRRELDQARQELALHDREQAPRFRVFDYLRPDENLLSDIVADLLDPRGPHGQDEAFLRLFLRLFLRDLDVPFPTPAEKLRVHREHPTVYLPNPLRRIDILLDFGASGIGIENKPWAQDQNKQVVDYLEHLHARYGPQFLLVYLSGDGTGPDEHSLPAVRKTRGQFRVLAYPTDLAGWLQACAECSGADKVRGFLLDFVAYVKSQFRLTTETGGGSSDDHPE